MPIKKKPPAQHNAALNRNQELSVNAPEFIPKFSAPLGDWSGHPHHQEAPSQVYPPNPQVFAQNSRPFPPHQQQIPYGGAQQRPYVYQQNRGYGQNRPDLSQNHHNNHHPSYSNNHQQMYMMNHGGHHQMGNNYHGGHGGQRGIQNRLNFNAQNVEPVPVEPAPHKQVSANGGNFPPVSLTLNQL
jgi:hypothetical protein